MKLWLQRKSDLTYIVGGKCIDGVVLVGDKRITVDNGADHFYDSKLFAPYSSLILGSSGTTGLFTSFHDRLIKKLEELREQKFRSGFDIGIEFKLRTEQVIRDMGRDFNLHVLADELEILMAYRTTNIPQLICYNGYGLGEPVSTCRAIGHGEPYGSVLLKTLWNSKFKEPLTMEEFAKLGCLIIEYIQKMKLDDSVGTDPEDSNHKYPQVWYMPNIPDSYDNLTSDVSDKFPLRELDYDEVQRLIMEISDPLTSLETTIKSINL